MNQILSGIEIQNEFQFVYKNGSYFKGDQLKYQYFSNLNKYGIKIDKIFLNNQILKESRFHAELQIDYDGIQLPKNVLKNFFKNLQQNEKISCQLVKKKNITFTQCSVNQLSQEFPKINLINGQNLITIEASRYIDNCYKSSQKEIQCQLKIIMGNRIVLGKPFLEDHPIKISKDQILIFTTQEIEQMPFGFKEFMIFLLFLIAISLILYHLKKNEKISDNTENVLVGLFFLLAIQGLNFQLGQV